VYSFSLKNEENNFSIVLIVVILGMIISIAFLSMFIELRSLQEFKVVDVDLGDAKFNDTQLYLILYIHFRNPANISIVINELKYRIYLEKDVKMLKIPLEINLANSTYKLILKAALSKRVPNYRVDLYVKVIKSGLLGIFRGEYTSHNSVSGLISLRC